MPWNEQNNGGKGPWGGGSNGDGDGGSPWNRPGGGRGGSGGDLEDQMRRMQERFRRGVGGRGRGGRGGGGGGLGPAGFIIAGLVALFAWLFTGVVIVDAGEQAAVFRFGRWVTNYGPGFHVHMPVPLERHVLLPVENQNEIIIGSNQGESLMLTGDENIADIRFSVFWKINTDHPEDFILQTDNPALLVRAVSESVMREVVGKRDLEGIITNQRLAIQQEVQNEAQSLLDFYDAGVEVIRVQILRSDAPQSVKEAFLDVVNAEQDRQTTVNQAERFSNRVVTEATGEADRIREEAAGYEARVVNQAEGEANRFDQIFEEYRRAPRVTRERMFLETMERVLGRSDKIILDSEAGAVPYLPLDRLNQNNQ